MKFLSSQDISKVVYVPLDTSAIGVQLHQSSMDDLKRCTNNKQVSNHLTLLIDKVLSDR